MKATWKYIEKHHEQYGAALFIVPALLCPCAVIAVACLIAWAFQ